MHTSMVNLVLNLLMISGENTNTAEEEDQKKAILLKNIKLDLNIDLESLRKEKTKTVVKLENKKNNKNNKKQQ